MSTSRMIASLKPANDILPPELISHLFSILPFNEAKKFREVSQHWRDLFDTIPFNAEQNIYCDLFEARIDLSTHRNFGSFLVELKKMALEQTELLIQAHQAQKLASMSKKANRQFRTILTCAKCCHDDEDLNEEELQSDASNCEIAFWSVPAGLLGISLGTAFLITTLLTDLIVPKGPVGFLLFALISMFGSMLACSGMAMGISYFSTRALPAIASARAGANSREFLTFYNRVNQPATDIIMEIPEEDDTRVGHPLTSSVELSDVGPGQARYTKSLLRK